MSAPPPPTKYNAGDIFQVQLIGDFNGRPNMNTFHFEAKRNNLFISDITDDIVYITYLFKGMCCIGQHWTMWRHRRVRPLPVTNYGDLSLLVQGGVHNSLAMPPQIATLFRITTLLDARTGRGRVYIPATPIDWWDGTQWTFAARSALNTISGSFFDQWKSPDGFSGNMFLGVASNTVSPVAWNRMIGCTWGEWPVTQRRRGHF